MQGIDYIEIPVPKIAKLAFALFGLPFEKNAPAQTLKIHRDYKDKDVLSAIVENPKVIQELTMEVRSDGTTGCITHVENDKTTGKVTTVIVNKDYSTIITVDKAAGDCTIVRATDEHPLVARAWVVGDELTAMAQKYFPFNVEKPVFTGVEPIAPNSPNFTRAELWVPFMGQA